MKDNNPSESVVLDRAVGHVLRQIRTEHGLSQEELGLQSGYHRTYISQLERGQKNPSLRTLFRLAEVLEVEAAEIIRKVEAVLGPDTSKTKGK